MPPPRLIDLDRLDYDHVVCSQDQIYGFLPQRHEFVQLDRVIHFDPDARIVVGCRNVRSDEWWCRGHLPEKAIFPGVLMVEAVAQLAAIGTHLIHRDVDGFMAFGGIDAAKFRDSVLPPAMITLVCRGVDIRKRRTICESQAFVDGQMVFEGKITGLVTRW